MAVKSFSVPSPLTGVGDGGYTIYGSLQLAADRSAAPNDSAEVGSTPADVVTYSCR